MGFGRQTIQSSQCVGKGSSHPKEARKSRSNGVVPFEFSSIRPFCNGYVKNITKRDHSYSETTHASFTIIMRLLTQPCQFAVLTPLMTNTISKADSQKCFVEVETPLGKICE